MRVIGIRMHSAIVFHGGPDHVLQPMLHPSNSLTLFRFEREQEKRNDEGQFDGYVDVTVLCTTVMDHGVVFAEQRKRGWDGHKIVDEIIGEGGGCAKRECGETWNNEEIKQNKMYHWKG